MEKKFNTLGHVNSDGTFSIFDKRNMNIFLNAYKGKKVMLELKVFNKPSSGIYGYFHGIVIPRAQSAWEQLGERYSREETEYALKLQSPVTLIEEYNKDSESWDRSTRSLGEVSSVEMNQFIEDIYRFCAEHLDLVLPDPKRAKQFSNQ